MKDRLTPFPDNRVHFESVVPDPLVFFIEEDEMKDGSIRESAVYLAASDYLEKFPPNHVADSLNDLLSAGIDLKLTNPRLLDSSDPTDYPSQSEMLSRYESVRKPVQES